MSQQPILVSILKKYETCESNEPVLVGHLFAKMYQRISFLKISEWATQKNVAHGFSVVPLTTVANISKKFKHHKSFFFCKSKIFLNMCEKPVHILYKSKSCTSTTTTTSSTTNHQTYCDVSTQTEAASFCDMSTQTQTQIKELNSQPANEDMEKDLDNSSERPYHP